MKIKERTFSYAIKGTRNFNSVNVSESITVGEENFNALDWEQLKTTMKERIKEEALTEINSWDKKINIDKSLESI